MQQQKYKKNKKKKIKKKKKKKIEKSKKEQTALKKANWLLFLKKIDCFYKSTKKL